MARDVTEYDGGIRKMFTSSAMLLLVNEHAAHLDRALGECRRDYEIIIEAVINAQKSVLQPHIITAMQITNQMKWNHADIPSHVTVPVPLGAAYRSFVVRMIVMDVVFMRKYLVYVIRLPLTDRMKYSVYGVLPLLIRIRH
jgi:hypothetical protein